MILPTCDVWWHYQRAMPMWKACSFVTVSVQSHPEISGLWVVWALIRILISRITEWIKRRIRAERDVKIQHNFYWRMLEVPVGVWDKKRGVWRGVLAWNTGVCLSISSLVESEDTGCQALICTFLCNLFPPLLSLMEEGQLHYVNSWRVCGKIHCTDNNSICSVLTMMLTLMSPVYQMLWLI